MSTHRESDHYAFLMGNDISNLVPFFGRLLSLMGLSRRVLHSLPISSAAFNMLIVDAAGSDQLGWMWLHLTLPGDGHFVEMLTEVAVQVSLFAVGLRLQVKVVDGTWRVPVLLATVAVEFVQDLEKFVELAAIQIVVARPLAVMVTIRFPRWTTTQRRLGAWFGMRGLGDASSLVG